METLKVYMAHNRPTYSNPVLAHLPLHAFNCIHGEVGGLYRLVNISSCSPYASMQLTFTLNRNLSTICDQVSGNCFHSGVMRQEKMAVMQHVPQLPCACIVL